MIPCQRHQKPEESFVWLFWSRTKSRDQTQNKKEKKVFSSLVSPELWRHSKCPRIRPVLISYPSVGQIIEPEIQVLQKKTSIQH